MTKAYRTETDSLGEVTVPAERLYGAQTARSLKHFAIGQDIMPIEVVKALALVKKAAAFVNHDLGKLDAIKMRLIIKACDEIIAGKLNAEFTLSVWQTGSGTQTNMNVNEVIANRATQLAGIKLGTNRLIHANDHVNMSQSTNDAFPTAMYIAATINITQRLIPALNDLRTSFSKKEKEFKNIVKIGRTHLQDATPLTLGQEFSGYVSLIERNIKRVKISMNGLYDLAIGGTAVGTGLNAPPQFAKRMAKKIATLTKLPFKSHPNKFAALSAHDELTFASSALKVTACALMKIANDIRWLASGPRCGLNELTLPENEPGSSIMPGKINPTQCEALTMVATQVIANDTAIAFADSQGNFELNVFKPVMIYNFLHSVLILKDAVEMFNQYCIKGLKANRDEVKKHLQNSLMLVTALSPKIGYDKAAKIAHTALKQNISLREACVNLGYLSVKEFDRLVVPEKMTHS
jgi:fumarate hydratase, class II